MSRIAQKMALGARRAPNIRKGNMDNGLISPSEVMQQMKNQIQCNTESYEQYLQRQLGEAQRRQEDIAEALGILERSPDLQRFLEIMGRI